MVTFKNMTVQVNFGPEPLVDLGFKCRMVNDAAAADTTLTEYATPADGKYEALFPLFLPDEGTFHWLDWFLGKNPEYAEISDRKIIDWAMKSGLFRPRRDANRLSNDRPEMNFGIAHLDDGSVKEILATAAAMQERNVVVMEIQGNMIQKDRAAILRRFNTPHFRRVAK
ncbi:unnamed protein product, partial [Polarella glacialis]